MWLRFGARYVHLSFMFCVCAEIGDDRSHKLCGSRDTYKPCILRFVVHHAYSNSFFFRGLLDFCLPLSLSLEALVGSL